MKPSARVLLALSLLGCSRGPVLRGKIAGLQAIVEQAERNGAVRCAPRELAVAKSQLEFASLELDQGFVSKAEAHLWKAEPNTRAAYSLSPPDRCADRGFVDVTPAKGDRDGDGVPDSKDKCPAQPENFQGFEDEDGCPDDPDSDGDGVADSRDSCVMAAEDRDGYLDDDGCPEPDNDLDGLIDAADKCPLQAEDLDGYEDDDGCPDNDNDNDAVLDAEDQCPNEVGSSTQAPLGCPTTALVLVTDCEVKITQQIHFEYGKDKIRSESFPVLDAVVDALQNKPSIRIEVQGHTDNKGGSFYNKDLSNRRSRAVMKYLVTHGVPAPRLTAHGYGFERPLLDNSTEQNRSLNRRVQFVRTDGSQEGCPQPAAP